MDINVDSTQSYILYRIVYWIYKYRAEIFWNEMAGCCSKETGPGLDVRRGEKGGSWWTTKESSSPSSYLASLAGDDGSAVPFLAPSWSCSCALGSFLLFPLFLLGHHLKSVYLRFIYKCIFPYVSSSSTAVVIRVRQPVNGRPARLDTSEMKVFSSIRRCTRTATVPPTHRQL